MTKFHFPKIKFVLVFALVIMSGLFALFQVHPAAAADSDTTPFSFDNLDAEYYLSRDSDNTSVLKVSEAMTAEFALGGNYNHGIERAIPQYYRFGGGATTQSHSFALQLNAVYGGNYSTYSDGGNLVVRIGDANAMVSGTKDYGLDYQMTNVTRNFADGDEFYWNVNGVNWDEEFREVSATVHVAADLASRLDGRSQCWVGDQGSTAQDCTITSDDDTDGGKVFTIRATGTVAPHQTLTFDIGFQAGTFAAPPFDPVAVFGAPWSVLTTLGGATLILTILALIILIITLKKYRPAKTGQAIIPQYAPPADLTVAEASVWWQKDKGKGQALFAATLLNAAVNKYIQVYEIDRKILKDTYGIRITGDVNDGKLSADEKSILTAAFDIPTVGAEVKLSALRGKASLGTQITLSRTEIQKRLRYERGFYRSKYPVWFIVIEAIAGLFFFATMSFLPLFGLLMLVPLILMFIAIISWKPLSLAGAQMTEYLVGLKFYMSVAEAERLKILQSVAGAERVNTGDGASVVKLYEKLLPYAAIFGITGDWLKVMQVYYTADNALVPAWFVGANLAAFNVDNFATAVNSFATTVSSSSSGFSGGGGFAGGGGGGGGGGGW